MIREGKPIVTQQTNAALAGVAREKVAKRLTGAAKQTIGTTFSRAIQHCPGCVFAAVDNYTGYVFATSDPSIRDSALHRIWQDEFRSCFWYAPEWQTEGQKRPYWRKWAWQEGEWSISPNGFRPLEPVGSPAFVGGFPYETIPSKIADAIADSGPAISTQKTLASFVNQLAGGNMTGGNGFFLWFDGEEPIQIPWVDPTNWQAAYEPPVLCAYDAFYVAFGLGPVPAGTANNLFARWLVSQYCPEPAEGTPQGTYPQALAVLADAEEYEKRISPDTGDQEFRDWYGEAGDWVLYMTGFRSFTITRLESGNVPPWLAAGSNSRHPVPPKPSRNDWTEETLEKLTTGSNYSLEDVFLELDNT